MIGMRRGPHDMLAGTTVVYVPKTRVERSGRGSSAISRAP